MDSAALTYGASRHTEAAHSREKRPYFDLPKKAWYVPLAFLLSFTLVGLRVYPMLAVMAIMMIRAWRHDRYDFIIQFTIFAGCYGFIRQDFFPLWPADIALGISIICWLILRKPPMLKKVLALIMAYFAVLVILALLSIESMHVQIFNMRHYFQVLYLIIPVTAFAGREFDLRVFFTRMMPYIFIICAFYISDSFIIPGNIFIPNTFNFAEIPSYLWDPYFTGFGSFFRKYPPGLFLIALVWYPVVRMYRLRWWQWCLIIGALLASFTSTVVSAFAIAYLLFQTSRRRMMALLISGVAALGLLLVLDAYVLPYNKEKKESALRISSTIDQFVALKEAADDVDVAEFMSGRIGQILPKVEVMMREHRMAIGLGFLHRDKTKISRYIIDNEYYSDIEKAEEVVTGVEVSLVQVFINVGWIGLAAHLLFFFGLYFFVRKKEYASYYLSVLFIVLWFGIGGFASTWGPEGNMLISFSFGLVYLVNRKSSGVLSRTSAAVL